MKKIVYILLSVIFVSGSVSADGYQGDSGQKYQYDMNNGNDRLKYSVDIDAQQRDQRNDMYDTSGKVQQDKYLGQHGGGAYSGDDGDKD